jgi:hypothetical protein
VKRRPPAKDRFEQSSVLHEHHIPAPAALLYSIVDDAGACQQPAHHT